MSPSDIVQHVYQRILIKLGILTESEVERDEELLIFINGVKVYSNVNETVSAVPHHKLRH